MTAEPTVQDKQITIDVPADRVAEFYAFYGLFLGRSLRRRRCGREHRCGGGAHSEGAGEASDGGETQTA